MMDYEAEARELTRRFRSHSDADLSLADVQWLDREIAAALRRAAEEAEVRAFGDRAALVAAGDALRGTHGDCGCSACWNWSQRAHPEKPM